MDLYWLIELQEWCQFRRIIWIVELSMWNYILPSSVDVVFIKLSNYFISLSKKKKPVTATTLQIFDLRPTIQLVCENNETL